MNASLSGFYPYIQYQYDRNLDLVGGEILMRSINGEITEEVRILESKNQIHQLDLLAFKSAIDWSKQNQLSCSCNFSEKSLRQKKVFSILAQSEATQITIELTETSKLIDPSQKNLETLSLIGFNLSLDDFGNRNSCLATFLRVPFKEVKLDRSIVSQLDDQNLKTVTVIKNLIKLFQNLNCQIVAEGIDKEEQLDILLSMGCDRFQGFLLHKPEAV